jgi:hypothetical protein
MRDYKNQISSKQGPLLDELQELFQKDFANTTDAVEQLLEYKDPYIIRTNWEEIKKELEKAVSKIQVRAVHGEKRTGVLEYHGIEDINYDNYKELGLSVIAVGGNRLSRGITLEGLSVSYYLRTSRMYDSLMQMGRWFGYRPGYVDLCRLFTTDELVRWYRHVIVATEEMRADFDEMASNQLRPKDYKLKVRTHSGLLSITSASKMRYHEIIRIGFSGDVKQTYELRKDDRSVTQNLQALTDLLKTLPNANENNSRFHWIGNFNEQVTLFLDKYISDQPVIGNSGVLSAYIKKQVENGKLVEWAVALKFKDTGNNNTWRFNIPGIGERNLTLITRKDRSKETSKPYYSLSQQNISDPPDRYFDLNLSPSDGQKHPLKDLIHSAREQSKRGLLVIYPLDWGNTNTNVKKPIIGFFLAFPRVENETLIEYAARLMYDDFEESQPDDEQDN